MKREDEGERGLLNVLFLFLFSPLGLKWWMCSVILGW